MATAARTLIGEKLDELESNTQLSQALLWQREQAWKAWENYQQQPKAVFPIENLHKLFPD